MSVFVLSVDIFIGKYHRDLLEAVKKRQKRGKMVD
jgi:hypothetical protein